MEKLLPKLESISLLIGRSISYLLLLLVFVTVSVVIIRYVFESGSIVLQESITYVHASLLILAMGYCFQEGAHVRVDIFYQNMSMKKQAIVDLAGTVLLLLPFSLFTFWISLPYVERSWGLMERSADAGGIPAVFLLKSLLLALAFVLIFQVVIEVMRNIIILAGRASSANIEVP